MSLMSVILNILNMSKNSTVCYDLISDAKLLIYPLMAKHSNNNSGTI